MNNRIIAPFLYARDPESHKGCYGHALLVAGGYGKMGAAVLAARACLRSGVGLLTVHVPRHGVEIMQMAVPEAMVSIDESDCCFSSLPKRLERYDAIAVGPGIGTEQATTNALLRLLEELCSRETNANLVLDADALNILSCHPECLHLASGAVITPHAREYQRLFGTGDPQSMSDLHNLVIVKKSHHTNVYSPFSEPLVNNTGNPGMATAGSGDVLTGIMLGVTAQNRAYKSDDGQSATLQQVAALAVFMHGQAGDEAAKKRGSQYSLIASDIIDSL